MIPESEKGRSLAGTDAVRPAFRAHLRVETVPGEGVYLISERSVTALRGSQAVALRPLLDGSWDRDAPAVPGGAPRAVVRGLLGMLSTADLLTTVHDAAGAARPAEHPVRAYWELTSRRANSGTSSRSPRS